MRNVSAKGSPSGLNQTSAKDSPLYVKAAHCFEGGLSEKFTPHLPLLCPWTSRLPLILYSSRVEMTLGRAERRKPPGVAAHPAAYAARLARSPTSREAPGRPRPEVLFGHARFDPVESTHL